MDFVDRVQWYFGEMSSRFGNATVPLDHKYMTQPPERSVKQIQMSHSNFVVTFRFSALQGWVSSIFNSFIVIALALKPKMAQNRAINIMERLKGTD